ncbi:aldehyde oxidase GLOX-like protein [Tanacetum coccineum]
MAPTSFLFVFLLFFINVQPCPAAGGSWSLLLPSVGISAMHMQLLPNDRVVMYDRTDFGTSNISLFPNSRCRPNSTDCSAHSVEYDVASNSVRPLMVLTNVWCSSGTLMPDGTLSHNSVELDDGYRGIFDGALGYIAKRRTIIITLSPQRIHGDHAFCSSLGVGLRERNPVLTPVIYHPNNELGSRFEVQNPSAKPRVYHSTAVLLRDGRVLVGGSNPHDKYEFTNTLYPTELSLEAFYPYYLVIIIFPDLRPHTLILLVRNTKLRYGKQLVIVFTVSGIFDASSVKVTMVSPSFNTHSFSMNQRLLKLDSSVASKIMGKSRYQVVVTTPPSGNIAPAGNYILFVVHKDIPSPGFYVTEDRRYLFILFVLFLHGLIMKAGFLDLSGGGEGTGITSVSNTIVTPTPLINTSAIPIAVSNISVGSPVNAGIQSGIPNAIYMGSIPYINVDNLMSSSQNASANKNGGRKVGNEPVNVFHSSYAAKLSPTSSTKANLRKLEANVLQDADYDVWLPLVSVHEVNDRMKNSPHGYIIGKRLAFSVVEWEEKLCKNSIENDACNYFSDNLLMAVPNLKGTGYTKETIRVEYEWEPPRFSTCLIFGHSLNDCPKSPKRVVNIMDKGKGGSSGADDEGFVEVKKKKSSGNNGGNKNFKSVSMKQKPQYHPKAKQFTEGANQKTNPSAGKKNVSTSSNGTVSLKILSRTKEVTIIM